MNKKKSKNIVFLIPVLIIILLCLIFIFLRGYKFRQNKELVIMLDGKQYVLDDSTKPTLNKNQRFTITTNLGFNTIDINNGSISVIDSDCRDEICIHTGKINFKTDNDMIVCAPHRLCIYIR